MSGKLLAAVGGLLLGLLAASLPFRQETQAQQPALAQNWEYKAVQFGGRSPEADTKKLNDLAGEGWEYVGLLGTGSVEGNGMLGATVAFRRPKVIPPR